MWEWQIFSLMANHERRIKGRMDKIRGKKTFMAGQTQVFAASHPIQLSLHTSSKAKRWRKAWPPWNKGFRRQKQLRIKTAASDRITEPASLGRLAVLDTIFRGLISGVWNVLRLYGTRGKNILKGFTNQASSKVTDTGVVWSKGLKKSRYMFKKKWNSERFQA